MLAIVILGGFLGYFVGRDFEKARRAVKDRGGAKATYKKSIITARDAIKVFALTLLVAGAVLVVAIIAGYNLGPS